MSIWFDKQLSLQKLFSFDDNTMNKLIGIEWTEAQGTDG